MLPQANILEFARVQKKKFFLIPTLDCSARPWGNSRERKFYFFCLFSHFFQLLCLYASNMRSSFVYYKTNVLISIYLLGMAVDIFSTGCFPWALNPRQFFLLDSTFFSVTIHLFPSFFLLIRYLHIQILRARS